MNTGVHDPIFSRGRSRSTGDPSPAHQLRSEQWRLSGDPDHIRHLLGDRVSALEITPVTYTERMPGGPRGYCQYYKETFGPVAAIYATLTPQQAAVLDRDFLSFATQNNTGPTGGPAELDYQYIRVIARRA
jgi:hypothetical protein